MKLIKTTEAVGHILCHDLTRIVKGVTKDAQFRKGHVVTQEDIPMLLSMGKENLYVWEKQEGMLHENDGAERLYAITGNTNMARSEVKEGKIELSAACDGLFRVEDEKLRAINSLDDIIIATRRGDTAVKKGDKLAGMRVIPLVVDEKRLDEADRIAAGKPILELLPYRLCSVGVITTGSEVFHGRIQDTFTPVIEEKLHSYGMQMTVHKIVDDGIDHILAAIDEVHKAGVDMVLCTGGMSVDPDDNTPGAIKQSGARIVAYGAPVLPGAMFLLGYFDDGTPIMGLPGCVMYAGATIFDLVLPRAAAGVAISKADLVAYGNGGLCLGCKPCHYPVCPFGK